MSGNMTSNGTAIFNPPEIPIWGFWVKQVATPIVTVVGLTGNTLSFLVMGCSKRLCKKSYSQLLCMLAIFDSLNLVTNQVELIDEMNVYKSGRQNSFYRDFPDSACKIYNFLKHVFLLVSSWLVVCLSVERVQAVCFPFRRTFIRRRFSVAILVTLTIVILSLTQMFRILFIENVNGICMAVQEYLTLYVYLHQYGYHLSLLFALPCVIVLSCNFAVIYQIYVIRKEAGNDRPRSLDSTRKATTMLLLIGFVFIITMFPQFVCTCILLYYTEESRRHIGQHIMLNMRPYLELFTVVSYTNYSINFAIYVLCGKSFRREVRRIFKRTRRGSFFGTRTRTKEEVLRS
ncbi:growth hormone secretagogue receptor type 1-like [Saccostrea echinata]|uniref:growth hormone secretagogue receptor type 1-like n=1 Tax=Saccostrea echinata TaxID=191078 RepID=UPI002A7F604E|nr:growth hormone secretagogue receptor type 1-like [Saccostrea echinata]